MLNGSCRPNEFPQLADARRERPVLVLSSWTAPAPAPVVRVALPEDHSSPDTPLHSFLEGRLQTGQPDRATSADRLGTCQVGGALGEEQIMLAGRYTRPTLMDVVHSYFLCLPETSGGSEGL
ncbi:hypothetical protein BMS3Bbin01_01470 [bacterium BMS3Bbin01]|nr:hypothetical protein BMS3Bbin01_01470 [bacterium BMS3Bbin01]